MYLIPAQPYMPKFLSPLPAPSLPQGYKHVGQWLEDIRKDLNLSPKDIENKTASLGDGRRIERSYYERIESGAREPWRVGSEKIEALRIVLRRDRTEWETRLGVITPSGVFLEPSSFLDSVSYPNEKYAALQHPNQTIAHNIVDDPDYDWYPIYSFASASLDATLGSEPFIVDYRRLEKVRMPYGYTIFRVQGDSMQPTLYDGEDIRVDTTNIKLSDDDIYLLAIPHGQVCVKRVRYLDGEWWMFSDHPDQKMYRPQRVIEGTVIRGHCESKFPVEQVLK